MSRTDSPREYKARILSSNPWKRRWRLRTIFGRKLPSRSRGASISTFPCSQVSVFGDRPVARLARAARRLLVRLIADVVGQLDLHRPLHQPLGQLRQQPAGPSDLLLGRGAGEQLVDHLIADPPVRRHPESLTDPTADSRPVDDLVDHPLRERWLTRGVRPRARARRRWPAPISARSRSLRSSPANTGAIPSPRASNAGARSNTLLLFSVVLLLVVGIAISFARAHTVPRTIPEAVAQPFRAVTAVLDGLAWFWRCERGRACFRPLWW